MSKIIVDELHAINQLAFCQLENFGGSESIQRTLDNCFTIHHAIYGHNISFTLYMFKLVKIEYILKYITK